MVQNFYSFFIDRSCIGDSIYLCCSLDVDIKHLKDRHIQNKINIKEASDKALFSTEKLIFFILLYHKNVKL